MRWLAIPALAVFVAGCGGTSVPSSAIAVVGGTPISRASLAATMAESRRAYAARGQAFPAVGSAAYRSLRAIAVSVLVDRAELELEAKRLGVAVTPAQIAAGLRRFERTEFGGNESRFRAALRHEGETVVDVKAAIRVELLTAALRRAGARPEKPRIAYANGFAPAGGS